jgi:hypothetical protein
VEEKIYQILKKHKLPLKKREELIVDLLGLFSVSNSDLLSKFNKQLDKLQEIHGKVTKTYDMHPACNGYKFEDGATYRIRLDKATGQATLD